MAADTYQKSVLDQGYLMDGEWYCTCGQQAGWRTTKTGAHSGQKFLRCQNSPQCRFFLWEKDEPTARDNSLQNPPSPQTPTRGTNNHSAAFPTPTSRHNTTARHRGVVSRGIGPTNISPISFELSTESQSSGNAGLITEIKNFLHKKNVKLSTSDEIVLDNIVNTAVGVYELRLENAAETIGKLRELSRDYDDPE